MNSCAKLAWSGSLRLHTLRLSLNTPLRRGLSVQQVFDRGLKARHRALALNLEGGGYYDYLRVESAASIVDRVEDITRSFPKALELGSYNGHILKLIGTKESIRGEGGVGGITELVQCDIVGEELIGLDNNVSDTSRREIDRLVKQSAVSFDEEEGLPFEPGITQKTFYPPTWCQIWSFHLLYANCFF
jgi:hypothetical protein